MASNLSKKMQSVNIADDSDSDSVPGLEEGGAVDAGDPEASGPAAGDDSLQSRGERKARKLLSKLGLKKIESINRVTMRRPKNQFIIIANAEVYKSPVSDCYIVFGEARAAEDNTGIGNMANMNAASQFAQAQQEEALAAAMSKKKPVSAAAADEDDGEEVDETGVDPGDVDTVMQQVKCSRAKAVKALKDADGDLINAIMNAS